MANLSAPFYTESVIRMGKPAVRLLRGFHHFLGGAAVNTGMTMEKPVAAPPEQAPVPDFELYQRLPELCSDFAPLHQERSEPPVRSAPEAQRR